MISSSIAVLLITVFLAAPSRAVEPDFDDAALRARQLLADLVKTDTTNPPGNEARAVRLAKERLKAAGIPFEAAEFAPGRENLTARLKGRGGKKAVLILAHVDVVGAEGQSWSSPPHELTEKDGYLYGRGASDDLGMAAVALEVLALLKRSEASLDRDVILAWTGDEESGGAGIEHLLATNPGAIDAEIALNEGGGPVIAADGRVKFINLQVGEKIYQDFELAAEGPTGHSSVPLADNAIFRIAAALKRVEGAMEPARLHPAVRAYFKARAPFEPGELGKAMAALADARDELPADALKAVEASPSLSALLRTTCVATLVSGGTRVNALPAGAKANVNCRILPDDTSERVQARLVKIIADPKISITPLEKTQPAAASSLEGPGPRAIRAVVERMHPGAVVIPVLSRGATDSRFLRGRGIAAYGFEPIPLAEEDERRAHGVDERIPAAGLRTGVETLYRLLLELDRR